MTSGVQRSNLGCWQQLQDQDYFENHPLYSGIHERGGEESVSAIEWFRPLSPELKVVNIGCGYGRETLKIAPRVGHVYGIDVSERILDKAMRFLGDHDVHNFTPILAENYKSAIPADIDIVFSIVVMQHLTRDLVRDYFNSLALKLRGDGAFIVQFVEELVPDVTLQDAQLCVHEPSVSWSLPQLVELCLDAGLDFGEVRTSLVTPKALWHWSYFVKAS
jgi:SAM-dependent methyltransferase